MCIGEDMMMEEYCSYILSRDRNIKTFTIPGSNVLIDKNELLTKMREILRDEGDKDYDSLLVNTMMCFVSKEHLGKNQKFDENIDSILNNTRKRVESINMMCNSMKRPFPFSYERVFEILVYYLRLITNILKSDKNQIVRYLTAEISPEAVIYMLNHKLTSESLDAEWERKRWDAFYKDVKPLSLAMANNYLKFMLLATYIRYSEIREY